MTFDRIDMKALEVQEPNAEALQGLFEELEFPRCGIEGGLPMIDGSFGIGRSVAAWGAATYNGK